MGKVWVEFTQSSRKHKVGRERIRHVLANPVAYGPLDPLDGGSQRLLLLGADASGRRLEVIAVVEADRWVVIHAMDLRAKFQASFERGRLS